MIFINLIPLFAVHLDNFLNKIRRKIKVIGECCNRRPPSRIYQTFIKRIFIILKNTESCLPFDFNTSLCIITT